MRPDRPRYSTRLPPPIQQLVDAARDQPPEVQQLVREFVLLDHNMRRTVAEVAEISSGIVAAVRDMGRRDADGVDIGTRALTELASRFAGDDRSTAP